MSDQAAQRRRLFLHGGGRVASSLADTGLYLDHAQRAVFVAYAVSDVEDYTSHMQALFESLDVKLTGLHTFADPAEAIADADAIVVGGGNTFRLIKTLHRLDVVGAIRHAVDRGTPYWGASAGANVACPTIRTTNDMPIVEPPTLDAMRLVPFQINPHYVDEPSVEGEVKETREFRILEFLEDNDVVVVGLRESSWLVAENGKMTLHGESSAVLFQRGEPRRELQPGDDLSFLLDVPAEFDAAPTDTAWLAR